MLNSHQNFQKFSHNAEKSVQEAEETPPMSETIKLILYLRKSGMQSI